MRDIYFCKEYAELCTFAEEGKATEFLLQNEYGTIRYLFLLRPIIINGQDTGFFDIVSPYGYGGPMIEQIKDNQKETLLSTYKEAFSVYCHENKIVSEFVRFHPIYANAFDFKSIYEVIYSRKTIGTNLTFDDVLQEECTKSCRKHIRQILKSGVEYRVIFKPDDLDGFKDIYYSTMERNHATDYYYFSEEYFDRCLAYFKDRIVIVQAIYNGLVIAMNLCFVGDDVIHIHLSGTLQEYLYLSPAYILRYGLLLWGKENGYRLIHHGGGRSSSEEDSLYLFKKQFGVRTQFDFYIGKIVWNKMAYDEICSKYDKDQSSEFFPAYRA